MCSIYSYFTWVFEALEYRVRSIMLIDTLHCLHPVTSNDSLPGIAYTKMCIHHIIIYMQCYHILLEI